MRTRLFLWLFVFCFSCKKENVIDKTEFEVRRPLNISINSQWVGGLDGGEWFLLSQIKNDKKFRIRNYFSTGKKHWDAIFSVKKEGFNPNIPFKFISISNYSKCTIIQKNKQFSFVFVKDF